LNFDHINLNFVFVILFVILPLLGFSEFGKKSLLNSAIPKADTSEKVSYTGQPCRFRQFFSKAAKMLGVGVLELNKIIMTIKTKQILGGTLTHLNGGLEKAS
jgi:hypothetical protein